MKKIIILSLITIFIISLFSTNQYDLIEGFENEDLILYSYEDYDIENNWSLSNTITYGNSASSLYLSGNNSKYMNIDNQVVDSLSVWSVAANIYASNQIIAFGVGDSINTLFYQLKGYVRVDSMNWIDDYLGAFSNNSWHQYFLKIGADWYGLYEYYPSISKLYFINKGNGLIYLDHICDHTNYLEPEPLITINSSFLGTDNRQQETLVQFSGIVHNYESTENFTYLWDFGDGNTSTEPNPTHIYTFADKQSYKVLVQIQSNNGKTGYATKAVFQHNDFTGQDISISFVGDIMLARNVGAINPLNVFDGVRDVLQSTDLRIANLESPLSTSSTPHPTKPIKFQANPSMVQALTDVGIDKVSLANNHILDYMEGSLLQTQATLANANILYSGAGLNEYEAFQPLSINYKGKILTFLASSDRDGSYNNYQPFLQAAYNKSGFYKLKPSKLKAQLDHVRHYADIKIVEMHAGSEYSLTPSADYDKSSSLNFDIDDSAPKIDHPHMWDSEIRHFAIDEGADIVVVHHQHIIQGFEIYKKKLIAHGLGNFVFDLQRADTKPTMILKTKINNEGFYDYEVIPAFIQPHTPRVIYHDAALRILDYLVYRSKEMDTYLLVNRRQFTAKIVADTSYIEPFFTEKQAELNFDDSSDISTPLFIKENNSFHQMNTIEPFDDYQYRLGRSLMHFGGFENEDFNQWSLGSSFEYTNEDAVRGLYSIKNSGVSSGSFSTTYRHRVMSNNEMTFYARTRQNDIQSITLQVFYHSTPGSSSIINGQTINLPVNNNDNWETVYANLNVPANAGGFSFHVSVNGTNNDSYIYFDDVDIIEWDNWMTLNNRSHPSPNSYYYMQLEKTGEQNLATAYYTEIGYNEIPVTVEDIVSQKPNLKVSNNYPNPFNPSTTIQFSLERDEHIEVSIYNIKGQKVTTLLNQYMSKGRHSVQWQGTDKNNKRLASGIYLYSVKSRQQKITKKMLLIK